MKKNISSRLNISEEKKTIEYYSKNFFEVCKNYESADFSIETQKIIYDFIFDKLLNVNNKLADIGCGSGRDLSYWNKFDIECYGVDASQQMIGEAIKIHPELSGKIIFDTLPHLKNIQSNFFDVIICSAVLMHLNTPSIDISIKTFNRIIKPYGKLIISIPLLGPSIDTEDRNRKDGRLFTNIPSVNLEKLLNFNKFILHKIYNSSDSLKRGDRSWSTYLCELR